jgi:L-asparaginase II
MCPAPGAANVRVYRGAHLEAVHSASVAVVDAQGRLMFGCGEPELPAVLRSTAKPFQALPLVLSGAAAAFGLAQRELAIACASHNGTDAHVAAVTSLLERTGAGVDALKCGAHLPIDMRLRGTYPTHGEDRDPLRHNCSGKHAGFLAVSRRLGEPAADYLDARGAVQTSVRHAIEQACDLPLDSLVPAIDGCSAPTYALPLTQMAAGFVKLARGTSPDPTFANALATVRDAMLSEPFFVSGDGRFDYDLARSFPGNVVNKGGAEAILGIGFRDPALGIALKIHDGGERALAPLAVAVLCELGLVDELARFPLLERHARPKLVNYVGLHVGELRVELAFSRA